MIVNWPNFSHCQISGGGLEFLSGNFLHPGYMPRIITACLYVFDLQCFVKESFVREDHFVVFSLAV